MCTPELYAISTMVSMSQQSKAKRQAAQSAEDMKKRSDAAAISAGQEGAGAKIGSTKRKTGRGLLNVSRTYGG